MLHEQDQAAGVFVLGGADRRRMQHREGDAVLGPRLPGADDFHRQAARLQGRQRGAHAGQIALAERRRRDDAANREAIGELRHAVEVIEIAVREEERIDPANAARPEERSDVAACHVGPGGGAGVIDEDVASGRFNDGAAAVADGDEGAAQFAGPMGPKLQRDAETPARRPPPRAANASAARGIAK